MSSNSWSMAMFVALFLAVSAGAQESVQFESPRDEVKPIMCRAKIQKETLLIEELVPETKTTEETFEVDVPFTELVIVDGKEKSETKVRKETRTREVTVTTYVVSISEVKLNLFEFAKLDGERYGDLGEVKKLLKEFHPVVFVFGKEPVSPYHRQFLSEEVIVAHIDESRLPVEVDDDE